MIDIVVIEQTADFIELDITIHVNEIFIILWVNIIAWLKIYEEFTDKRTTPTFDEFKRECYEYCRAKKAFIAFCKEINVIMPWHELIIDYHWYDRILGRKDYIAMLLTRKDYYEKVSTWEHANTPKPTDVRFNQKMFNVLHASEEANKGLITC